VLVALAGAGMAAPASGQQTVAPDPVRGREVATQMCRGCHLIARDDRGPVADGVPSFMAMADEQGTTPELLEAKLIGEHPVMPQPPLTTQQTADVVAYILALRR
jgi:mono/diheme cytochrome c family protein